SVYRSEDGFQFSEIESGLSDPNYIDTSASNNVRYYYRFEAHFNLLSKLSSVSTAVIPGLTPETPSGLNISDNSTGNSFSLNWSEVTNRSDFHIYMSTNSGGPYTLYSSTTSASGNIISGLSAGTTYYLKVSSLNGTLESPQSAYFSAVPST